MITPEMWATARCWRLHGMPGESCCLAELTDRFTQQPSETWRIEQTAPDPELFEIVCVCTCVTYAWVDEPCAYCKSEKVWPSFDFDFYADGL